MLEICWRFCSFPAPLLICGVWTLFIWDLSINVPSPPPSFINLESSGFMMIFKCKKVCWFTKSFGQGMRLREYFHNSPIPIKLGKVLYCILNGNEVSSSNSLFSDNWSNWVTGRKLNFQFIHLGEGMSWLRQFRKDLASL